MVGLMKDLIHGGSKQHEKKVKPRKLFFTNLNLENACCLTKLFNLHRRGGH